MAVEIYAAPTVLLEMHLPTMTTLKGTKMSFALLFTAVEEHLKRATIRCGNETQMSRLHMQLVSSVVAL